MRALSNSSVCFTILAHTVSAIMVTEYNANKIDHSLKRSGETITSTINKMPTEGTAKDGIIAFLYMTMLT